MGLLIPFGVLLVLAAVCCIVGYKRRRTLSFPTNIRLKDLFSLPRRPRQYTTQQTPAVAPSSTPGLLLPASDELTSTSIFERWIMKTFGQSYPCTCNRAKKVYRFRSSELYIRDNTVDSSYRCGHNPCALCLSTTGPT
jgi:hypothetical protein